MRILLGAPGFTLLETLIVLAIMAVVAGAAVLTLGGGRGRDNAAAAQRLTTRLQYAVDETLISGRELAFVPDKIQGYRFLAWNPAKQVWAIDSDPELAVDKAVDSDLQFSGLGASGVIRFRPSGESDPFSLLLTIQNRLWNIHSDGITVTMATGDAR